MDKTFDELIISSPAAEARISEGIERNRKGFFKVTVTDGEGKPVDATVKIKQKSHEFKFGCNMFMLDEIPDSKEKNEAYKEKLKAFFNILTVPFYWDATEPEDGKTRYDKDSEKIYRRPPTDLCVEWCEKNGIEPREHALCYDHFFPEWIKSKTPDEIKFYLDRRMREVSERYASRIPTIEVTNELAWDTGSPFYFEPDFVEWCFKTAEKYFPANKLGINDWCGFWDQPASPANWYYTEVENAMLKGARVDAIGMQYHMFFRREHYFNATRKYYNLDHLYAIMDRFSHFNKPIEITEITVPAFSNDPADERLQADIIEKLYKVWFSHEKTEKIIYWNLADGYAAFTTPGNMTDGENYYYGGLLRFDMSEKPAYERLRHLITEEWHTELTAKSGESFKAFYGDYDIEVTANGKSVIVPARMYKSLNREIKVKLD